MSKSKRIAALDEEKHSLLWGTYGRPVTFPVRWVKLIDCSTEHLLNILKTQFQIDEKYRTIINYILEDRSIAVNLNLKMLSI